MVTSYLAPTLPAVLMLSLVTTVSAFAMEFTVENPTDYDRTTVARVSIPVPAGEVVELPHSVTVINGERRIAAEARVITRHPDDSVRR